MFGNILVPLDRSTLSEEALGRATAIARASEATIDLILVHEPLVVDGFVQETWTEREWAEEEAYLKGVAEELLTGSGVRATYLLVHAADPVDAICQRAREQHSDLIVMSSHGRTGWNRLWMGSVADGVMRRAAVPVLMLRPVDETHRPAARKPISRILVPLDGSAAAAEILPTVEELARCYRASITLLRVVRPVPQVSLDMASGYTYTYPPLAIDQGTTHEMEAQAAEQIEREAAKLVAGGGLFVDTDVVVEPHVALGICRLASQQSADLIAMCTHGRGASRLLVGSVADKVIRGCGLPVLIYHPTRDERLTARAEGRGQTGETKKRGQDGEGIRAKQGSEGNTARA